MFAFFVLSLDLAEPASPHCVSIGKGESVDGHFEYLSFFDLSIALMFKFVNSFFT